MNASNDNTDGVTMFEHKGDCISTENFQVFQTLGNQALASARDNPFLGTYDGMTALFISDKPFYDEQIISVPKDKCVRQVGIYNYETQMGKRKTVPVAVVD